MKKIIMIVALMFLTSTIIYAWGPGILYSAGARIVTSQGAKRVVAKTWISKGLAKQVIKDGVGGGGSGKVAYDLGKTAAALLGLGYLLVDFTNPIEQIKLAVPGENELTEIKFADGTPAAKIWTRDSHEKFAATNYTTTYIINIDTITKSVTISQSKSYWNPGGAMGPNVFYQVGTNNPKMNGYTMPGYTVVLNVTAGDASSLQITQSNIRPEPEVDQWIEQNKPVIEAAPASLVASAPAGATMPGDIPEVVIVDEPAPGENPGELKDPDTGEDLTPVEDPATGDAYNTPSMPMVPLFDPTMDIPDKMSIPDKITDFMNNAPFMNVINNFQVNASSGSSSLTFTVWGRSYQWDFARYEDFYNMMAAVLLALAYIWSAQIVFGGRA